MKFWKLILIAILTFIIVSALLAIVFLLVSNKQKKDDANKAEVKELMNQLSSIMELPAEEPTVATVVDKTKVNTQPFFAKAENGDKLIIFVKSQKAILYRPAEHKIIDFGPINVSNTTQPTETTKKTVTVLNGSTLNGATITIQKELADFSAELSVTNRDNAKSRNYPKTIVTDLTGNNQELVNRIAQKLNADVASISTLEAKPKTDILIIAGKNVK